jgi:hypothetical protein
MHGRFLLLVNLEDDGVEQLIALRPQLALQAASRLAGRLAPVEAREQQPELPVTHSAGACS